MPSGGETRPNGGNKPAHRNWTRVAASWFVVFFIVASWSILFRAVSPLLFGSGRHTEMVLKMAGSTPGELCVVPVGPGLAAALDEGRVCDVTIAGLGT